MKAYTIFDDFGPEAANVLTDAGIELVVHPEGRPRPDEQEMARILEEYDCVIIGTSQKIRPWMFDGIHSRRIIATASVGTDHISVPEGKKNLIQIVNAPKANAPSVAEYTLAAALRCARRLDEGRVCFLRGEDNKKLSAKPEDLSGKTIGVVGAGAVSVRVMELASAFGMHVIYWTAHPERHDTDPRFSYVPLEKLAETSDVISVNLPDNSGTKNLISADLVRKMKESCIFISVSRLDTVDYEALFRRAEADKTFYVNLDIDCDGRVADMAQNICRVNITPHIAGGTAEGRKRMFLEAAEAALGAFREGK